MIEEIRDAERLGLEIPFFPSDESKAHDAIVNQLKAYYNADTNWDNIVNSVYPVYSSGVTSGAIPYYQQGVNDDTVVNYLVSTSGLDAWSIQSYLEVLEALSKAGTINAQYWTQNAAQAAAVPANAIDSALKTVTTALPSANNILLVAGLIAAAVSVAYIAPLFNKKK